MKISARNRLKDRIVDVKEGAPARRTSRSRLAAESYGCDYRRNGRAAQTCKGKTAYAVIKMSDFMVELD
jgi:molybdopterin-binding protein